MSLFILSFFLLYGGLHYYILHRIRDALALGIFPFTILVFFMFLMVIAPLVVYTAGSHGWETLARSYGHVGFIWMGFAFLFFAASVVFEIYRGVANASGALLNIHLHNPDPSWRFFIPLIFGLLAATYGYFDALHIRTEHVTIKSPKIPPQHSPTRIVQISDVHLGVIVRGERLALIMNQVKKAGPDLFVSTGDLLDGQVDHLGGLTALLQEVRPRLGKFAITGNHEYYAGLRYALEFTRQAGFTFLRGQAVTVDGWLNLAGVDDPAGAPRGQMAGLPERELLAGLPPENFTLFLKHRPVIDSDSLGSFDLQISGHTHKGQIFPFVLLTRLFFTYYGGFFRLPGRALLYVSRGSGTWGPPIRFLTPPEVTVYELIHEEK